ncbi:UDP-N-acetylmuramoyl-L-alanyl-D-glutamate--2,6-diaminopimelate ligase [Aquibacillus koreensis]|uniref:UDP-N-acetylmuramyl-tripeptide synthetase n=1 Tax=Aquibacillus koreensis TaxID=279446 RepID=A0A9X3WQH6_9BACI|nr:UDP-N-acetylmuramoyl-L-alanyl-D-glutamate--2,6-diaminopimelate ligase [Aquibacillus koreensis]MCT2534449.1 UDP-N-acetylmuramoyl-L-alanyl-D-glutamate--2,6-diaminopimelate ligase [Aquibacillus koreensis]MDC3421756.1 UDP-N-acetylmuramoyl-L-alanyl-D-glutamate--2,6-diaminopimelate ligase [Aquibacillus koreensis]
MQTSELFSYFTIKTVIGELPLEIDHIHVDSREVQENSIFICTKGFTVDSHEFYHEAIDRGATVIVSEKALDVDESKAAVVIVKDTYKALAHIANKFYDYPSSKLNIFGVTGTNGKTTVTTLIYRLLQHVNQKAALTGTIGFEMNGTRMKSENTTCDLLTNQKLLQETVDRDISNMVMEVSSHGLCQGRLWGIDFDVVTFTNLSQDHLDYHDSMEQYGYIKGLLFAQLGQDLKREKYIVLNEDDPWFKTYSFWSPFEVISYGLQTDADFTASNIQYKSDHTTFTLHSPEGEYDLKAPLLGEFNVYNILAAMASLFAKGIHVSEMVEAFIDMEPINGRMEKLKLDVPVDLYVDYAHTSDAIEKSIQAILPFKQKRLIFLVGTGGDRDPHKRPDMGKKASAADYVILTINDPRTEDPNKIVADMEKGMLHENYVTITERKAAIAHAIEISEPGDIVVFAGKGQEDYQVVGTKKVPHSDFDLAREFAEKKYKK